MSELQPAAGQGAEFFTERSIFYLQNRVRINEWWNLRHEVTQAISHFLDSLVESISDAAAGWTPWDGPISRYRCLFLVPPGVDTSEFPWTGVALGWVPQGVMPDIKNQAPWVGVYGFPEHEVADKLRFALDAVDGGSSDYESSKPWPRYRWVPGVDEWWTDLDSYRQKLLEEHRSLVSRYSAALESVVT